ncbi:MAG TPA: metal ABC transporter permease [Solirubrobacterales bacterium]|nr:metal ABC transporter permease [Solirubrobacterales bacterium]
MSDDLAIILTAGLLATACGLLGPFLILRRQVLLSDAVSHAVLPGIVLVFLLFGSRAPLAVIVGAGIFAIICVLGIEMLRNTGLVHADAAIGLVFPALFAIGVIGVTEFAGGAHLDLDSTIYGEIAFTPFRTWEFFGVEMARSLPLLGVVTAVNLTLLVLFWKELKATTFDPGFSRVNGISPTVVSRLILIAVAVTAVTAFESVGAILVVTMLIVPAAASYLLTVRLLPMVIATVAIGWISAVGGYGSAVALDASIGGAMGLAAAAIFCLALLFSPRYGAVTKAAVRLRRRGKLEAPPAQP